MKKTALLILVLFLLFVFSGYAQEDSIRTKNDKPGTPQSLRTPDQSPQSSVNIINASAAPGQTTNNAVSGINSNTVIIDRSTVGKPVPTTPITIMNTSPGRTDSTVSNGAIRNGVSNATNPIRNK